VEGLNGLWVKKLMVLEYQADNEPHEEQTVRRVRDDAAKPAW
jgi:hypothetical protein